MPRAKTDSEKFRAFLTGKTVDELRQLKERLEDIIAAVSPALPKRTRKTKSTAQAELLETR